MGSKQTVIVTGASQGIGAGIVQAFLDRSYNVVATSRNASKAGFVNTIAVLLEHGADPSDRDDNGLTPLDWVERATPSVDREAVRRLLRRPRVLH